MDPTTGETRSSLEPFRREYAPTVASWMSSDQELRWLSPCTPPPLTSDKVLAWHKPGNSPFLFMQGGDATPAGYGELNRMRRDPDHHWLGHVVIRPGLRGRGLGNRLVGSLVQHAFGQLSAKRISLIVFPDNRPAIECYTAQGFALVGDEFHRFVDGGPKEHMLRFEIRASGSTEYGTAGENRAASGKSRPI
ncbi:MAG: GNAT family N-acetyltransferase [Phycisphaerales bacterium]|nr:MAG: GNAT family N-acetyltransferase [Phycisphaerales bacterium]